MTISFFNKTKKATIEKYQVNMKKLKKYFEKYKRYKDI